METLNKVTVIPFSPAAYLKDINASLLFREGSIRRGPVGDDDDNDSTA